MKELAVLGLIALLEKNGWKMGTNASKHMLHASDDYYIKMVGNIERGVQINAHNASRESDIHLHVNGEYVDAIKLEDIKVSSGLFYLFISS